MARHASLQKREPVPIIPSAPKCSVAILSSIESPYVLSNPFPSKPSIVFSPHKPFYSQPNYSSWWLGIFCCLFLSNLVNRVPRCKHKQGSGWDDPFNVRTVCEAPRSRDELRMISGLGLHQILLKTPLIVYSCQYSFNFCFHYLDIG